MTEAMKEKMSARTVLAVLVGLLVTILALQGIASVKPGGFEAFAATTPAPTPTGPSIQFLNPAKSTSTELSDKDNDPGAGTSRYHLVAWTHLAPSSAGVVFQYDPTGDAPATNIGSATRLGNDTWEFFWDINEPGSEAGAQTGTQTNPAPRNNPTTGVLRALLIDTSTTPNREVARDEENVTVNNQDRKQDDTFAVEDQAETVEITYPGNAGQMGFFGSPDGTYTGIVDVRLSTGDATKVEVFYTVDPPGSEPNFVECGDETTANAADGVRCTLASGDRPSHVRAIAAVPSDRTQEPRAELQADDKDAADAHRVSAYEQDAFSVTITPQTDTEDINKCNNTGPTPGFLATVFDESGRKIAGANLDIHAQGPTDNLFFDDSSGNNSSAHQPPDQGGHTAESGVDCESTATQPVFVSGVQGDHEQLNVNDIKHVESTVATSSAKTAGTDDTGSFKFQLLSRDPGETQITAFVDEDFNDTHCAQEASGNASIGWGGAQPTTSGVAPEQSTCTRSTPGVTPGASNTASATATATATATSTVRPTNTATSTGPSTSRTVTMSVDRSRVVAGRQVTFSGQILSGDQSCTDNEFVQIRRRVLGTTTFRDILTTGTDAQGRFTFTRRVTESADYIAVATAHDNCREASSGEVTVAVKVKLAIVASDTTPSRGDRVRIKSSVVPQHDGTRLVLQRKKGNRWVKVAAEKLNRRSRAQFVVEATFGSRTFRTFWKSQDAEHDGNKSRGITIRT